MKCIKKIRSTCSTATRTPNARTAQLHGTTPSAPNILLRIKVDTIYYERLSHDLDYTTFMAYIRELFPNWDDITDWVVYRYPQQAAGTQQCVKGAPSWEALMWRAARRGYEEVEFEVWSSADDGGDEVVEASPRTEAGEVAPPAYSERGGSSMVER